jgi:AcrR family transcriptional regulator
LSLLRRFGEDKLTVVDIARTLGMSHANVYRYFGTRGEILDAIIEDWMAKVQAFVDEIAVRPGSAAARLEAVLLELHRRRRQKLVDDPEVYQTVRRVFELRPEALTRHREAIEAVFRRLLSEGIAGAEFRPMEESQAAEILLDATVLFVHPLMIPTLLEAPGDAVEQRTRRVVAAILAGFRPS